MWTKIHDHVACIIEELSKLSDAESQERYGGYVYPVGNGEYVWAWIEHGELNRFDCFYKTRLSCFVSNMVIR